MPRPIQAEEYGKVACCDGEQRLICDNWRARPQRGESSRDVAARLGLHKKDNEVRAGDYVGLVWWPDKRGETAVRVTPKFEGMDYYAMYLACMADPEVSKRMGGCFHFWPEQPLIEINRADIPLSGSAAPFAAAAFVSELYDLIRRNMRKNFVRTEENLTGRCKGRMLMGQQLRRNLTTGRMDRNYCQYSGISDDCLENQILLAALQRCAHEFANRRQDHLELKRRIRVCRAALGGVTLRRTIHNRDFAGIRYTGSFVHYRRPHALARMVLNHQELDPSHVGDGGSERRVKVVPFALCTSELFERYTEFRLRQMAWDMNLMPGDGSNIKGEIRNAEMEVRPDFLIRSKRDKGKRTAWVLDSKYKRPGDGDDIALKDFGQLAAYAAHSGVQKVLNVPKNENYYDDGARIRLGLIYPCNKKLCTGKEHACDESLNRMFSKEMDVPGLLMDFHAFRLCCPVLEG